MYFADMVMTDRRDTADPRFDRWLSRRLHEAYDGVLKEQLPEDLDRLMRQFSARQQPESGSGRAPSGNDPGRDDDGGPAGARPSSVFQTQGALGFWQ